MPRKREEKAILGRRVLKMQLGPDQGWPIQWGFLEQRWPVRGVLQWVVWEWPGASPHCAHWLRAAWGRLQPQSEAGRSWMCWPWKLTPKSTSWSLTLKGMSEQITYSWGGDGEWVGEHVKREVETIYFLSRMEYHHFFFYKKKLLSMKIMRLLNTFKCTNQATEPH